MKTRHQLLDRCSVILLPLASIIVFAPGLGTFFAQDDFSLLARAQNATADLLLSNFALFNGEIYRPLREVYFAVLFAAFGLNPYVFHLVGWGLLVANSALLGALAHKIGLGRRASLIAATFYATHSALLWLVIWSAAAGSLLAVFWSLLALLLLIDQRNKWLAILGVLSFAIALTSREGVVVLPAVLLAANRLAVGPPPASAGALSRNRLVWPCVLLLVVALYLILRWNGATQLAGSAAYRLDVGLNAPLNFAKLAVSASGFTGSGSWSYQAIVVVVGVLFWLSIALFVIRAQRCRRRALFGLAWFVLGILPVVFLSTHAMDSYYLDFSLLGLAVTVGACYQTVERRLSRLLKPGYVPYLLISCLVAVNGASIGFGHTRSPVVRQADRAQQLLSDVRSEYPILPEGAVLELDGLDEATAWAMAFGDLYRVGYRDPSLRVSLPSRSDALSDLNATVLRFRMVDRRLLRVSPLSQ